MRSETEQFPTTVQSESITRCSTTLNTRLEYLERRCRRNNAAVVALLSFELVIVAIGASRDDRFGIIAVEGFVVRNSQDKQTVSLLPDPDGMSELVFYDDQGRARAGVGGNGFSLYDKDGRRRIEASLREKESRPRICLWGKDDRLALAVSENKEGGVSLTISDKGRDRCVLQINKDGKVDQWLLDDEGATLFHAP